MKFASLKQGGRDGTLVVVDRALKRAVKVGAIASTLQAALETWPSIAPRLVEVAAALEAGARADAFDLKLDALASPLPRAYQFLDGSVYLGHMEKARSARGAAMPPNYKTEPLMYQGLSDHFMGPTEPIVIPDEALDPDYEPEIAVILDDVPMGTTAAQAAGHIKLVMLLNDVTLRALTAAELPKQFGFLQAKPTSAFSPVAVTLDELGSAWDGQKFHGRLRSSVNGKLIGQPDAGVGMFFTYPQLIAHAARTRRLTAGTILGAGTVSNEDHEAGHGCIAELRVNEQLELGAPRSPFLKVGDRLRIEMLNDKGESIFGAIDQTVGV
jgi:fumarylacetoacetate (FAA) hydrolase